MKFAPFFLSLMSFASFTMQSPQAPNKAEIVNQMLELKRADYANMFDRVASLDLDRFSRTSAPWQMPDSVGGRISIVDPRPVEFQQERSILRNLAITKECAPLIGYLLTQKKLMPSSDAAQSMLLHAVAEGAEQNVSELLQSGVDPKRPSFFFFDTAPHSILLRALGYYVSNKKDSNPAIVRLLLNHKANPNEEKKTLPLLQAVDNYYSGQRDCEILVIQDLLAHGADPNLMATDCKWVGYLREGGDYVHSAMEAARILNLPELLDLFEQYSQNKP